jgi:hypothetical protein
MSLYARKNRYSSGIILQKKLIKAIPLITAVSLLTMLAVPVFATGAHLWFYSVDPSTLTGYPPLVNPDPNDPNYVGVTADPWTTESVVVVSGDWDTPFNLWIGNADPQDDCYDTTLVISINDAAHDAISGITVTPGGAVTWDTNAANFPLPPHGISNSAEFYAFGKVIVGDIASDGYMQITIDITPNGGDLDEAKIHFDAYGWSEDPGEVGAGDPQNIDITSPFSHDSTFIVPEATTILAVSASLLALGAYAYKRKKQ